MIFIPGFVISISFLSLFASQKVSSLTLKVLLHSTFVFTALLLMTHQVSGFNNLKLIDKISFSPESIPYTMYINFDKPFLTIIILSILGFGGATFSLKKILKTSLSSLFFCSILLLGLSLSFSYIQFSPKLPQETLFWAFNNFFLVCFAEESFFRRYIQGSLMKSFSHLKNGNIAAILVAASLFGLAHYKGGITYVILSTVAGLFYGWSFYKAKRIEASVLTHFGLNLIHFLFFSYPALK